MFTFDDETPGPPCGCPACTQRRNRPPGATALDPETGWGWVHALEETRYEQCYGTLFQWIDTETGWGRVRFRYSAVETPETARVCALGILHESFARRGLTRPLAYVERCIGPYLDPDVLVHASVPADVVNDVVSMNDDDQASFREIAAYLRMLLPPEDPTVTLIVGEVIAGRSLVPA